MKPVIVFTICRRYHELSRAIDRLEQLRSEFAEPPDVVVVWARPVVGHLWFFQRLRDQGKIHHLLSRLSVPGEADGLATSYPESHSIRTGLEFVGRTYGPDAYVILQGADILPKPREAYAFIDVHMQQGAGAVLFHWPNGSVPMGIWHTNFFAVKLDQIYWPPLVARNDSDVLEWAWGKQLQQTHPPHIEKSHNNSYRRFIHEHLSEGLDPWPISWATDDGSLHLAISGYIPWHRRMADWVVYLLKSPTSAGEAYGEDFH